MAKTKKALKKWKFLDRLKKLDKRVFFIILFDVLFYVILATIVVTATIVISTNMRKVEQVVPFVQKALPKIMQQGIEELPSQIDIEEVREANAMIKSILMTTNIIARGALILIGLFSIFFRSLIWSKILKIKFSRKYFKKYFLLNIGWIVGWGIVLFLLIKLFKRDVILWVLGIGIVIYLYFTVILRSLFDEKKKSIDMIKQSFRIGTKKIHLVAFQYIPAIVIAAILAVLFRYVWLNFMRNVFILTAGVVFIVYFAWLRISVSTGVKSIQAKLKKGH